MKRATVYIVILGIVCTGLGVAIGIGFSKRHVRKNLPGIVRHEILRHPYTAGRLAKRGMLAHRQGQKAGQDKFLERLGQELNLSPEQATEVQAILEGSKKEIKQIGEQFRTQVAQVKERSNVQILEVLDLEQKEKFQELTAAMEQKREKRGSRGIK